MKVTVVGAGLVGSSFAYRMLVSGLSDQLVLIDVNRDRALGEAEDIEHAMALEMPGLVSAGDYDLARGSDFVVIAAGFAKLGEDGRLGLTRRNAVIVKEIVQAVAPLAPDAFYIVGTNPIDVMAYAAIQYSGLDPRRVIGSGTLLDSARFRSMLAQKLEVSPTQIAAFSLGEHGDSQAPIFSQVMVKGIALDDMLRQLGMEFPPEERRRMADDVRSAAYRIIERKGATCYGIASAMTRIVRAVHRDERVILPVSVLAQGECGLRGVCLSLPSLIDASGVRRVFDLSLSEEEHEALMRSAAVVREHIAMLPD